MLYSKTKPASKYTFFVNTLVVIPQQVLKLWLNHHLKKIFSCVCLVCVCECMCARAGVCKRKGVEIRMWECRNVHSIAHGGQRATRKSLHVTLFETWSIYTKLDRLQISRDSLEPFLQHLSVEDLWFHALHDLWFLICSRIPIQATMHA